MALFDDVIFVQGGYLNRYTDLETPGRLATSCLKIFQPISNDFIATFSLLHRLLSFNNSSYFALGDSSVINKGSIKLWQDNSVPELCQSLRVALLYPEWSP